MQGHNNNAADYVVTLNTIGHTFKHSYTKNSLK